MAAKLLMRINQKIVRKKRALEALQNSNVMALEDTGMNAEALASVPAQGVPPLFHYPPQPLHCCFGGITKQQCNGSGGYWNECGSPCAGTDAEMCIQVCQVQCECGGIAGFSCPKGYKCRLTGKIADERGVCIKE